MASQPDRYQAAQAKLAAVAAVAAVREWRRIDAKRLDLSWMGILHRILALVTGGQRRAAETAPAYLAAVLRAQGAAAAPGHQLVAGAFSGIASDGRNLASLLYTPVAESKHLMGQGVRIPDAIEQAGSHLAVLVRTQVADAGRMAVQAAMADDETVRGYVRQVHLPACARCIILAGRFYRYSAGFQRHPGCDCTMVPARGEQWVESQDPAELIAAMREQHPAKLHQSLSEGDLKALDEGADLNQVVNAHRGMYTAAGPRGRKVQATTEGTTRRGLAGTRLAAGPGGLVPGGRYRRAAPMRLSPAQIFDEAARLNWNRQQIVAQLMRHGYIL